MPAGPILLYDGLCGFCDRTVQLVLRFDRRGRIRFAALQGAFAKEVLAVHPELAEVDSLLLVEVEHAGQRPQVNVRSEAFLRLGFYLGGAWKMLALLRLIPRPLRDFAYDVFARHRYRLFGRFPACKIPTPQTRSRFLD